MARREEYESRTEHFLLPLLKKHQFELVDVEYVKEAGNWYLRAYIDKLDGVNIGDCENVSRVLSDALDAEDYIADAYILEVSSPGLGRTLKKDRHLEKSLGAVVEVKTYKPIDKQKEFSGILRAYDGETVTIEEDGKERVFQRVEVALIRLALDF